MYGKRGNGGGGGNSKGYDDNDDDDYVGGVDLDRNEEEHELLDLKSSEIVSLRHTNIAKARSVVD